MAYPIMQRSHYVANISNHKIDQWLWGPGQQRFYPMYYRGGEWHFYVDRTSSDAGAWWSVTHGGSEAFLRNNQRRQAVRKTRQPMLRRA